MSVLFCAASVQQRNLAAFWRRAVGDACVPAGVCREPVGWRPLCLVPRNGLLSCPKASNLEPAACFSFPVLCFCAFVHVDTWASHMSRIACLGCQLKYCLLQEAFPECPVPGSALRAFSAVTPSVCGHVVNSWKAGTVSSVCYLPELSPGADTFSYAGNAPPTAWDPMLRPPQPQPQMPCEPLKTPQAFLILREDKLVENSIDLWVHFFQVVFLCTFYIGAIISQKSKVCVSLLLSLVKAQAIPQLGSLCGRRDQVTKPGLR